VRIQVQKWGNSLALRIPKPFARDARVEAGTIVELSVSEGKLIAVPVGRGRPSLAELLAAVSEANIHQEFDTGEPLGREAW